MAFLKVGGHCMLYETLLQSFSIGKVGEKHGKNAVVHCRLNVMSPKKLNTAVGELV